MNDRALQSDLPKASSLEIALVTTTADDAHELAELRVLAMRASLEKIGRFDPKRARDRFLSGFVPADTRHIVCAGQRVGFVVVRNQGDGLLLDHLYLHPNEQGRGIGGLVLARILAEADAAHQAIRVGALKESDANRFYARHGFKLIEEAEFDNYYLRPYQPTLTPEN